MTIWLKQSTAVTVKIGPFIDPVTGDAETALTISQADVRLSKEGGNMAQKSDSTACTHDEIGIYDCPLSTTDTNTLGRLQLFVHESGALPSPHDFMVVPANVWDSVFGTDKLQAHVVEFTTGVIDGNALNTTAAAEIADTVWDEALSGHAVAGSTGEALSDVPSAIDNADALLKRDWTQVTGESSRSVLNALRMLRNKWTVIANALSVKKEDDSTEAWSATLTSSSEADPVTGFDPS